MERRLGGQGGRQHSGSLILPDERLPTPSEFVLVPVSVAARNCCCGNLRRRGDAASSASASASEVTSTAATTEPPPPPVRIPLLDGDNIVGAGVSNRLGLGIPRDTKVRQRVSSQVQQNRFFTGLLLLPLLLMFAHVHTKHQRLAAGVTSVVMLFPVEPVCGLFIPRVYVGNGYAKALSCSLLVSPRLRIVYTYVHTYAYLKYPEYSISRESRLIAELINTERHNRTEESLNRLTA